MMTTFPHLRAAVLGHPWAILPDRLEAIAEVIERRIAGVRLEKDEIAAIRGDRAINGAMDLFSIDANGIPMAMDAAAIEARGAGGGGQAQGGVIAVINVSGVIAQHAHQVDNISGPGGTSVERVQNSLRAALADPNVVGIIFKHDSPGGNVAGIQGLADEIYAARGRKPMVAQVDSMMASASYWLGSAADEIVMSPGAMAGSIGVYTMHKDVSGLSDKMGVKMSFISAGKFKVEGHPYEPLADEAAQAMQATVDEYYGDFAGAVAKYRGVKMSDVQNGFGEGRMLKDKSAVKAGLADRVGTFDDTLRRMASGKMAKGGAKAETGRDVLISNLEPTEKNTALVAHLQQQVADGLMTINAARTEFNRIEAIQASEPQPLEMRMEAQEDGGRLLYATNGYPKRTAIAEGVLSESDFAAVDGDRLTLTFANGSAVYTMDPPGEDGQRNCTLVSGTWTAPPPAAEAAAEPTEKVDETATSENDIAAQQAADRDAFRRRRHAHRMRNMG